MGLGKYLSFHSHYHFLSPLISFLQSLLFRYYQDQARALTEPYLNHHLTANGTKIYHNNLVYQDRNSLMIHRLNNPPVRVPMIFPSSFKSGDPEEPGSVTPQPFSVSVQNTFQCARKCATTPRQAYRYKWCIIS